MELILIFNCPEDAFVRIGNRFFQIFHEIFHILALRMSVGRAGAFNDRQRLELRIADNILLADVNQRTYQRDILPVEIGDRGERVDSAFVKQRQKEGFDRVVGVMTQRAVAQALA